MKRINAFLAALALLSVLFAAGASVSAATGSVAFSSSAGSVTVGGSVTLTVTYTAASVGAGQATVTYDSGLFQCTAVSGSGMSNQSSAAGVLIYTFAESSKKANHTFTCTFKSLKAGSGKFTLSSADLVTFDEEGFAVADKSLTVAVNNPTASANANLSSLKPSTGTLTPRFSASTVNYTVAVPYTTTSLSLSATAAEKGAKVAISGNNTLVVGKNTRVVTVTAPSGATKKYTVVITRSAEQTSAGSTTTTAPPAAQPLEVTVDGETMTVSDTQPSAELPAGYSWGSLELNGTVVSAALCEANGTSLLWLTSQQGEGAFYLYDAADGQFAAFRPLVVDSRLFVLLDMPAGQTAPTGTVEGECSLGTVTVKAFVYEDTALEDFAVIYATAPDGRTGLYVYDRTDGSLQRYHAVTVPAIVPVDAPVAAQGLAGLWGKTVAFFRAQWRPVTAISAAVAAVAVVVLTVVLLCRRGTGTKNCRH